MDYTKKLIALCTALAALGHGRAAAQDPDPDPVYFGESAASGSNMPVQRTQRELVLPEGTLRGDVATSFGDDGFDAFFAFDLGGGISIVENLEFGVSLNREWFWPRVGGGLLPIYWDGYEAHFWRIPIYARYQFLTTEHVAIAVDIEMNLATHRYSNFRRHAFRASLPVRLRFDRFMIDTGFTFEVESNDAQANLYVPAVFTFNATEALHFRAATGFGVWDMNANFVFMPLFFGGGYTFPISSVLADINLDFGFPYLVHPDGFIGFGDRSSPDIWMVKISAAVYIDVL